MFLSLTANTQRIQAVTTKHSITSPPPKSPLIPVLLLPPHHLVSQPLKSAILTAHGKSLSDYSDNEGNMKKTVLKKVTDLKTIVRRKSDLDNLNKSVTELIIDEGACNGMKEDLMIEGLNCLKSILVKKNSMKNLNSLKICNCKLLEKIKSENGEYKIGAFFHVKTVDISSFI